MRLILVSPGREVQEAKLLGKLRSQIGEGLTGRRIRYSEIRLEKDSFLVKCESEVEAAAVISEFPGVEFTAIVDEVASSFEHVVEGVVRVARKVVFPGESFKVSVDVEEETGYTASDLETVASSRLIAELADAECRIDPVSPSKNIFVQARQRKAYIFNLKYEGSGGLPLGVSGSCVCPETGCSSTILANWLAVRSGFEPHFVLFDLTSYAQDRQVSSAAEALLALLRKTPLLRTSVTALRIGEEISQLSARKPSDAAVASRLLLAHVTSNLASRLGCDAFVWPAGLNENPLWLSKFLLRILPKNVNLLSPAPALTLGEVYSSLAKAGFSRIPEGQWFKNLTGKYSSSELKEIESVLELREVSDRLLDENAKTIKISQRSDIHDLLGAIR